MPFSEEEVSESLTMRHVVTGNINNAYVVHDTRFMYNHASDFERQIMFERAIERVEYLKYLLIKRGYL